MPSFRKIMQKNTQAKFATKYQKGNYRKVAYRIMSRLGIDFNFIEYVWCILEKRREGEILQHPFKNWGLF